MENKQTGLDVPDTEVVPRPLRGLPGPAATARSGGELPRELRLRQRELEAQLEALQRENASLRESCERYADLCEFTPVGYLMLSHMGKISKTSALVAGLLGVDVRELRQRHFKDFILPDYHDDWHNDFLEMIRSGKCQDSELMMRRGDGEAFLARIVPLGTSSYGDDRVVRIALTDITEQKRSERESMALLQRYRILMDTSIDGIHIMDLDGNLLEANDAFCSMLGYTQEEAAHLNVADWDARWTGEELRSKFRQMLGTSNVIETVHRRKDGTLLNVEISSSSTMVDGQYCIFAASRDVTGRRLIEGALRESEAQFRSIVTAMEEGVLFHDGNGAIVSVNPAAERILGIAATELIGQTSQDRTGAVGIVREDGLPFGWEHHPSMVTLRTGEPQIDVVMGVNKPNGDLVWISVNSQPLVLNGESVPYAVVSTFRDITEIRLTKQFLEESQRELRLLAVRLDSAREEERKHLSRELHDDLGQYLTAMQLNASALNIEFGAEKPRLAEKLQRMQKLVDDTKLVVRHLTGKLRPPVLDMGIASALEWLVEEFSRHTGIHCALSMPESLALLDDCATAIFRTVQESLTNIARHADASEVSVTLERRGDVYLLKVRDNGKGFDVSGRSEKSFGLLGIRERVRMKGGRLLISSAPGKGTVITVRYPVC